MRSLEAHPDHRPPADVAATRAFVLAHNAEQYTQGRNGARIARKLLAQAKHWRRIAFMEARRR